MDFNAFQRNSKGNKIRKIKTIKKHMANMVDENQDIRRFMRYYQSKSPLSRKSVDYNGNIVNQPDIKNSLFENNADGEKVLFLESFKPTMEYCRQPYIFISSPVTFLDRTMGDIRVEINILCPDEYNELALYDEERIYEVAERIEDILDNYTIDGEAMEEVGALKLEMLGSCTMERLSKTDNVLVLSIPFKIKNVTMRSEL